MHSNAISILVLIALFTDALTFSLYTIAEDTVHQGDLILTGNDVITIEDKFDINGSIIVEENATLILRNAFLNFTQTQNGDHNMTFRNSLNGNPRLIVENATITASNYYLTIYLQDNSTSTVLELDAPRKIQLSPLDTSSATISDSTLYSVYDYGSATVNLSNTTIVQNLWGVSFSTTTASNCVVGSLRAEEFCTVNVSNSTIGDVTSEADSVNCSITMLEPGFFGSWNYRDYCFIRVSSEGYAPIVTLSDCRIERWNLEFRGSSNTSISHSVLGNLFLRQRSVAAAFDSIFTSVYTSEDSVDWLVNSTATAYIYGASSINVCWYLDVHVVDSINQDVPDANVTAAHANATTAESRLTDANGWARLTLMEKMINASGEYPLGNYTVDASYGIYSDIATVDLKGNREITLILEGFNARVIGDITGPTGQPDGKCDMRDIGLVARNFGTTVPSAPAYCDLTGPTEGVPDGMVDMRDVGLIAQHYGERYQ